MKQLDLNQYLSSYNEDMANLARDLRNMILDLVPDMNESIKWKNLFYEKNGFICAIVIHKNHVNLQFARGTELLDPDRRYFRGSGKKIRHMKIHNSKDINSEKLKNLITEAVKLNLT